MLQKYIEERKAELNKLTDKFITDREQDEIYARQDELNRISNRLEKLVSLQKAEIKLLEEFLQTLQDIYNTNDIVSLQTKLELHFENIDNRLLNKYHHNTEISLLSS